MRPYTPWLARRFIVTTAAIAVIYLAAYIIVFTVVTPLQQAWLPEITRFASLLFLPHGIRVFATSLLRGRAIPGLFLGEAASAYLLWGVHDPVTLMLLAAISGMVTWAVFEGLLALRINAFYLHVSDQPPPLHTLLLGGILASVANAFLMTSVLEGQMSAGHVTSVIAAFTTGDITGLLAVMLVARYGLLKPPSGTT